METAYLSPHRGASRSEVPKGQTSAGKPPGGDLSPAPPAPALLAGKSPDETPAGSDGRRNSGVKKHHHKHNLKHRYELLETLGRGTYGKVKKAIERHSGREVSTLFIDSPGSCRRLSWRFKWLQASPLTCIHVLQALIAKTNSTGPVISAGLLSKTHTHTHTPSPPPGNSPHAQKVHGGQGVVAAHALSHAGPQDRILECKSGYWLTDVTSVIPVTSLQAPNSPPEI